MKKILAGVITSLSLNTGPVWAQDDTISSVRKAAIEKMQAKLGKLRGSIDESSPDIFLTDNMIDRLKQIRPGDHIEAQKKAGGFVVPHNQAMTPDVQVIAAPEVSPARELYKAAGYLSDDKS